MTDHKRILNAILDNLPAVVYLKDPDGCYALTNPGMEQLLNLPRDEIIGKTDFDIFPAETATILHENDLRVLSGKGQTCEEETLPAEGTPRTFITHRFPVLGDRGEVDFVGGVSCETTDRKRCESDVIMESLQQGQAQFRQMAEALPQLVWVTAADGSNEYFNRKWYDYTGIDPDIQRQEYLSLTVHPDDYQRTVDRWNYSLRTGEAYEVEYRLRQGSDGSYRWFLGRALPFRDVEGRINRWFGTCTDIEAQKQAEENLKLALEELTRSNRELEQFAYVASHDLQEPLRMVASYVRLIGERYRGKLDQKADIYIDFAEEGAKRMQELIDDLLAFSRVARSANFQPVDFNEIFAAATENLSRKIEATGAEVTSEVLPVVTGDKNQLMELLQNLIDNAIKYRKPDTPPLVRVSSRKTEGHWEFSIRDNGIGIEPQYFGRIFLIFQRLHTREAYLGTGIGLASCKKIIERHHGRIWVDSEPGEGSSFHFTLPADESWVNPEERSNPVKTALGTGEEDG